MEWTPTSGEQERHNVTVITVGSKYEVYVRSPASSHMQTLKQPFQTLAIKWEVNIVQEVFMRHLFLRLCHASFIHASVVYHASSLLSRYDTANDYTTFSRPQKLKIENKTTEVLTMSWVLVFLLSITYHRLSSHWWLCYNIVYVRSYLKLWFECWFYRQNSELWKLTKQY